MNLMENRYSRLESLSRLGKDGLSRIRDSSVLLVGAGGTGSLVADLLCRAGVRRLIIIDRDTVSLTNLHRQTLYTAEDVNRNKADVAALRLKGVNSDCLVDGMVDTFDSHNALDLVGSADIVIDGTDNMTTRMIINDACVKLGIPWIFTSAIDTYGEVKAIVPGKSACLACFMDSDLSGFPTCADLGVLSSIPSMISSLAFSLAVKVIMGKESGEMLYFLDGWNMEFQRVAIARNADCRSCQRHNLSYLTGRYSNLGQRPML